MTNRRAEILRIRWVRLMQLAVRGSPEWRNRARTLARKVKAELQRAYIRERDRHERAQEIARELNLTGKAVFRQR